MTAIAKDIQEYIDQAVKSELVTATRSLVKTVSDSVTSEVNINLRKSITMQENKFHDKIEEIKKTINMV
jgi:2C-methyl-D-erythritol 2,4-cyclodiphosphate synthase